MFRSFTVKNFRCFRDLTIEPLERVNLIAGKNNVGKTALLEALFLHLGANRPQLPWGVNAQRGIEQVSTDPRDVWGWLFFEKRTDQVIELTSLDHEQVHRTLQLTLAEPLSTTLTPPLSGAMVVNGGEAAGRTPGSVMTFPSTSQLQLSYKDDQGRTGSASASVVSRAGSLELDLVQSPSDPLPMAAFLSTRGRPPREDAVMFSKLIEMNREEELVSALRILDPRIRHLLLLLSSGVPTICAVVGAGPPIPLPLMGDGLVRLLSCLLAIAYVPGGVVVIDEIENGLHYSVLVDVWRAIGEAAGRSDTQIFATTHSWECIRSANEALGGEKGTKGFRYLRLERAAQDIHVVTSVDDRLGAAIEMGLEVR
jgi:hypothetical protein